MKGNTIEINVNKLRDPFVLSENGVYYMYGTQITSDWDNGSGWACYKNISGRLDGEWTRIENIANIPKSAIKNRWAPEVHKYNGAYYMFASYYSSETNHRGCTILKSNSPEGPFDEITKGHITPADRDAIDGTLYVNENNQPWMVFVSEWTSAEDKIGRMAAARLSEDLTHFISEPVELFRADAPEWARGHITDGCFMYKTEDNRLLMLWSNFDEYGYCVGLARSKNGKIDGEWLQEKNVLFSKSAFGQYDGGHGMIFTDFDGQMYLSIHSPNTPTNDRLEKPVFIPLYEEHTENNTTLQIYHNRGENER